MKIVRLGKTGIEAPIIGFGGIPIQRLDEEEAVRVIRRCLDLGVTFVDTANGYTTSEERIGKALAGRREQVILATKSGARDRATSQQHLDLSLKRLQTDYIDIWQFHNVSTPEAFQQIMGPDGAMDTALRALQAGKIRHLGFSSHSLDMAMELVPTGHFETVQFPFNFITSEPATTLLPLALQHDVGFIAMKPMAGGLLDDARLAIKYLLQFDGVVLDPGIEKEVEIEEIVGIAEGDWRLTAADQREMERMRAELGTRFCRRCQYCQPCPQGIHITTALNFRSFWKRMPAERVFGGDLARTMEAAADCAQCGECEAKCPYQLPIREMLSENVDFYRRLKAEWEADRP